MGHGNTVTMDGDTERHEKLEEHGHAIILILLIPLLQLLDRRFRKGSILVDPMHLIDVLTVGM